MQAEARLDTLEVISLSSVTFALLICLIQYHHAVILREFKTLKNGSKPLIVRTEVLSIFFLQ